MGMAVTKNQLLMIASGMPMFQVEGVFSPKRFQRFVQAMFGSERDFFAELEKSFLQMQLEKGIVRSSFILPDESEYVKKMLKQRRDFGYFAISPDRFVKAVNVTQYHLSIVTRRA